MGDINQYQTETKAGTLCGISGTSFTNIHDDVIKWKQFPRYWPFLRGIHRCTVNSPHKGQWRGTLMFSLIYVSITGWVNNRKAGDVRRYRAHYDVSVMILAWPELGHAQMITNIKQWDVITHPYRNFNGDVVKPPLKSRYGWVIKCHMKF